MPKDLKIISWKIFSSEQKNAACSVCHAKMTPLPSTFAPGDRFFDHFDLATLEDPDFYPDGRDLGENYTYTSWLMSPCAKAGQLHCVTCHTSSGRYRFKAEEKANDVCKPCHESKVKDAPAHTHHKEGIAGNKCIPVHLKAALKADPQMAPAAYNLCVLLSRDRLDEAVDFCRQAAGLRRDEPRYAYILAFFQQQDGDSTGAERTLEDLLARHPGYGDAYLLLGGIHERLGERHRAEAAYSKGLTAEGIGDNYKLRMKARLDA